MILILGVNPHLIKSLGENLTAAGALASRPNDGKTNTFLLFNDQPAYQAFYNDVHALWVANGRVDG